MLDPVNPSSPLLPASLSLSPAQVRARFQMLARGLVAQLLRQRTTGLDIKSALLARALSGQITAMLEPQLTAMTEQGTQQLLTCLQLMLSDVSDSAISDEQFIARFETLSAVIFGSGFGSDGDGDAA